MKLIASFKISGTEYRVNGDGPEVFERLGQGPRGRSPAGRSSEVSEVQLGKVVVPVAANAVLHASDVKLSGDEELDFIAKTVLGTLVGLAIGHLIDSVALKEVKVIDVEGPCGRREVDVSRLITEWDG